MLYTMMNSELQLSPGGWVIVMQLDFVLCGSLASLLPSVVHMTCLPLVPRFFFLFQLCPVTSVPVFLFPPPQLFFSVIDGLLPVGFLMDAVGMHTCSHPCLKPFFVTLHSWSWYLHWLLLLHTTDFPWHEYIFVTVRYLAIATQGPARCILAMVTGMVRGCEKWHDLIPFQISI